jgi:hypothetical protein
MFRMKARIITFIADHRIILFNHNPSCFGIPGTMLTDIKVFGQSEVNVMNLISQDWSLDLDSSFIKSHLNDRPAAL